VHGLRFTFCEGFRTSQDGPDRRGPSPLSNSKSILPGAEPKVGIEPTAYALPRRCSTSELLGPAGRNGTNRSVDGSAGALVQFDLT
jgi:hypothetical protein